jgi:nucleoside-diphosphate-sugar epimerase
MGKRVILTGGTGFVGANLARRLLDDGHDLHLLVRPGYRGWRIEAIRHHVRLQEVHLADRDSVASVVGAIRPEWIFHLAAHGSYPSQTDRQQMVQTNIVSTVNLVEACLEMGFESFVNTGSSSEYGFKDHPPAETESLEPANHYAFTKASATLFCGYTARERGVHIPTVRLYSVFGPYEEPTRLIPTLILYGKRGELPPLVEPDVARDFVYAEDVAEAYCLVAGRTAGEPGAVYNVGTGVQTALREVVKVTRQTLKIKTEPQWGTMANRSWDTTVWVSDSRKIRSELGWRPRYSLETGFRELVRWFDDNPELLDFYQRHDTEPR